MVRCPEAVRNFAHGWATEDRPPPPPPPPPPRPIEGGGEATTAFRLSEALRNLELPSLPPPGGEGSSLQFGDWVTVITPLMSDIAGSARLWWEQVLQKAELTCAEWLTATPLEKLRLKPTLGDVEAHNHRVERRGLSMLLAALPDPNWAGDHLCQDDVRDGDHVPASPGVSTWRYLGATC